METVIQNSLFTVLGAVVAGLSSYLIARMNMKWQKARAVITKLAEQVAAYHKLEELYMKRVAELDPSKPPLTVQKNIRREVENLIGFSKSWMTARDARADADIWK